MKFEITFRKNANQAWNVKVIYGMEADAKAFIRRFREDGFEVID